MPHHLYQFGPYQLDPETRVLTRAGEAIALTPKAAEILLMLVMNTGQVVERDRLLREVWPDTFVEESNLSQNIFVLRQALGDDHGERRYIETVVRRGYRFIAHVEVVEVDEKPAADLSLTTEASIVQRPVVAVLPFLNATGDSGWEYLADGLTDNLINNLSRVKRLRVMSHSAVYRYKTHEVDPQQAGKELGATAVLVGKLNSRPIGVGIGVELVETLTGWQLWGESFDSERKDILEIQDAITRQLLATLKLKLTGEEEKRVTARYTENAEAYQSYLQGRYHWSRYTRKGIEKAIGHFRRAIELDANYALAYAAIVDCYLRLATNYLPPEDDLPRSTTVAHPSLSVQAKPDSRIRLRFEWEWKTVERELRRANDLKTNYPSVHQWYVAYQTSKQLYRESFSGRKSKRPLTTSGDSRLVPQIPSTQLTPTEEVQILCSVARDQIAIGNLEAASLLMRRWCAPGKWPRLDSLNPYAAADLLFTLGYLLVFLAGSKQANHGHKHAENFLSGSVALFEQRGIKTRSVEARIELARCYYQQGVFDMARSTLSEVWADLPQDELELRNACLALCGCVERDSGRLMDAVKTLRQAVSADVPGDLYTARCYHELAITLKELTVSDESEAFADDARRYFESTLYFFEAVGNHRLAAATENNLGFLLLILGVFEESEKRLLRSKRLFDCLSDSVRVAQVNETLTRLYIETDQYPRAQKLIAQAIEILEKTDHEALLAEALTTAGVVAARQGQHHEARKRFEAAYKIAERCGDSEGAGRASLEMLEEIGNRIDPPEKMQIAEKLKHLMATTQRKAFLVRVEKCINQNLRAERTKES